MNAHHNITPQLAEAWEHYVSELPADLKAQAEAATREGRVFPRIIVKDSPGHPIEVVVCITTADGVLEVMHLDGARLGYLAGPDGSLIHV
ncbi:hypothetical protein [Actinomarinicola tropica]|uniref:Uncharacterized protein n=1 Tax=Actinomarinicola tropica TaxID=2789776 RepID=A0A5Q2RM05_9ACTN|nr:hypothetical protein [Actinomarinicola tropica]QGG95601.1 hypothetical protein GH723_11120 [Actinomarinicola tropica]